MENAITIETLCKEGQRINIVRPEQKKILELSTLLAFLEENKDDLEKLLLEAGAILFRGFDVNEKEQFLKVKEVFAGTSRFNYVDGNSPRTKLSSDVYTSTEYPREYKISLHNEMSYSNKWPSLIFFYCKTPAQEGGETPVLDCRAFLTKLNPRTVDKFEKFGVNYTRYLSGSRGVGKSWMDTFETKDPATVENYCRENEINYSWDGNNLSLSQFGYGIARHPVTQEKVWFNQANQFHPSGLPDDIYAMLKMLYAKDTRKFPQYALFGNGEEIPEKELKEITDIQFECAMKFKWQTGDVLMLDNMLMAHGRMPFSGERKIYVSMC